LSSNFKGDLLAFDGDPQTLWRVCAPEGQPPRYRRQPASEPFRVVVSGTRQEYPSAEATRREVVNRVVARLNIEHYVHQLERETDEPKRRMLLQLIAEEEAWLEERPEPPKQKFHA
jgi:hypothetical protein